MRGVFRIVVYGDESTDFRVDAVHRGLHVTWAAIGDRHAESLFEHVQQVFIGRPICFLAYGVSDGALLGGVALNHAIGRKPMFRLLCQLEDVESGEYINDKVADEEEFPETGRHLIVVMMHFTLKCSLGTGWTETILWGRMAEPVNLNLLDNIHDCDRIMFDLQDKRVSYGVEYGGKVALGVII